MSIATDILQRVDFESGINVNYRETTEWYDGTPMDDSKKDDVVFKKKDGKFYQRTFDNLDSKNLIKKTIIDFREISKTEVLLLKMGIYKSVELQGYYNVGDTPKPIIYQYTDDIFEDNGGDLISTTNGNFITYEIKNNPCPDYFGAKKDNINFDSSDAIQKTFDLYNSIIFNFGTYYISKPIYVNKKENSLVLGKGRKETILKANPNFRVATSGTSIDGRFDFENALIIARRGTIEDVDSITIDPLTNLKIQDIYIDGSNIVPVGIESWCMFSSFKNIEITGTNLDAYVLRRGWNNSYDDFYVYYTNGSGVIFESECNSIDIGKMAIAHCGGNGWEVNQGHSINISSLSSEACAKNGIIIEDKLFPELEAKGGTVSAISGITVNALYLEANCEDISYSNIYINGNVAVDNIDLKAVYINFGNGRPLYIRGSLRKTINIGCMGIYSITNKSYMGFINSTLSGDRANITIYGLNESFFDFENNYEAKQVTFLSSSKSGVMSFNSVNLRKNTGNYRAEGDFEYDKSTKMLSLYVEDSLNPDKPIFVNAYNHFSQIFKGIDFHFFIINKMVHIRIKGTATESFTGDMVLNIPSYLSSMANFFGTEILHVDSDTEIQTRNYSVLYVRLTSDIALDLKLMYFLL